MRKIPETAVMHNGNFESGNTGFTSAHTFKATYRPPDLAEGQYQITTNATLSHQAWTNPGPQGNGTSFFVANASSVAGAQGPRAGGGRQGRRHASEQERWGGFRDDGQGAGRCEAGGIPGQAGPERGKVQRGE